MKHLIKTGLAAAVICVAMALIGAGSASATVLCKSAPANNVCPAADVYGVGSELSANSVGNISFTTNGGTTLWTCKSASYKTTVTDAGGVGKNVKLDDTNYSFNECSYTFTLLRAGNSELGWTGSHGGFDAAGGTEFRVSGIFGATCVYGWGAALEFTFTGGNPATIPSNGVQIPRIMGGISCPAQLRMYLTLAFNTPSPLYLEQQ